MALSEGMLRRSARSTNLIDHLHSSGVEQPELLEMSFDASSKKSRLEALRDNYRSRLQRQNDAIVHLVQTNPKLVDRIMNGQYSAGPEDRRAESEKIQRRVAELRDQIHIKPEKTFNVSTRINLPGGFNSQLSDLTTKSYDPLTPGRLSTSASPYLHPSIELSKHYVSRRHNTTELHPPDKHKQKQAVERLDWELNFSLKHIRERAQRKREYLLNHPLPSIPQSPFRIDEPSENLNEVFSISSSLVSDDMPPISLKPKLVRRHRLLQPIGQNQRDLQKRSKPKPLTKNYNNSLIRALEKVNEEREGAETTPLNELPEISHMITSDMDETVLNDGGKSAGSLNEYEKRRVRLDTAKLREIRERKRREQAQLRKEKSNLEAEEDSNTGNLPLEALRLDLERNAKTEPNSMSPIPGEDVLVNQPVSFTPPQIQYHGRAKNDLANETVLSQSNDDDIISKLIPADVGTWGKKDPAELTEEERRKFFQSRSLSANTAESLEINSVRTELTMNHRTSPGNSNSGQDSQNMSPSPAPAEPLAETTSDQHTLMMDISDHSSNDQPRTKNQKILTRESSHNSTSSDKANPDQHQNQNNRSKDLDQPMQSQQLGSSAKKRKTALPNKTQVIINEDPYFAQIADNAVRIDVELVECVRCMRKFAVDRIEKHMKLCSLGITRKPYSAQKHRIRGTEMEKFANYSDKDTAPVPRYRSRSHSGSEYSQSAQHRPQANTTLVCPNCKKTFSIQGFERHSQYCKEQHSFKKSGRQQQHHQKEQNFVMR